MKRVLVAVVFALAAISAPARAETKALFEIALDIDHDGRMDRAVLVGVEGTGFYAPEKNWFMIGAAERVDLYVYLGAGDAPLDLSRKPSFLKKAIIVGHSFAIGKVAGNDIDLQALARTVEARIANDAYGVGKCADIAARPRPNSRRPKQDEKMPLTRPA